MISLKNFKRAVEALNTITLEEFISILRDTMGADAHYAKEKFRMFHSNRVNYVIASNIKTSTQEAILALAQVKQIYLEDEEATQDVVGMNEAEYGSHLDAM